MITRQKSLERVDLAKFAHKLRLAEKNEENVQSFSELLISLAAKYLESQEYLKPEVSFRFLKRTKNVKTLGMCSYKTLHHIRKDTTSPEKEIRKYIYSGFEVSLSRNVVDRIETNSSYRTLYAPQFQDWIVGLWTDIPTCNQIFCRNGTYDEINPQGFLAVYEIIIHEMAHVYEGVAGELPETIYANNAYEKSNTHNRQFFDKFYELLENIDFILAFDFWYDKIKS